MDGLPKGHPSRARRQVRQPHAVVEGRRPLDDSDFDELAEFIAEMGRGRGQQASQPAHKVAHLTLALKDVAGIPMCNELIDLACRLEGQFSGPIEPESVRESVWTLIRNPKRLR